MDENSTNQQNLTLSQIIATLLATDDMPDPNHNEKLLLKKLQVLVNSLHWSPTEAANLFGALLKRFESTSTNSRANLQSWLGTMLHFVEINYVTPLWKSQTGKTVMQLIHDETVSDENLQRFLANSPDKQLDEILEEIRQQKLNQVDEKLLNEVRDIVSAVHEACDGSQQTGLKKDLLMLCQAVKKSKGFRPRLTQMVSWCLMALSKSGYLIQVDTGEGKSCIVAMFAAFRAMRGEKVDIMSSSSVLAERDCKEWCKFYKELKITIDCNITKENKKLKECYKCQVVYGTAEEFAGNWLMDHFQRTDIRGQRTFQCAIVDEVDSLMLDKGLHVVYIGSEMPALQHLNPLMALIWATANKYQDLSTEYTVGQKYPFHQVVLESIIADKNVDKFTILQMAEDMGTLAKGSVQAIRKNPRLLPEKTASVTVNQMAEFFKMIEIKFPSCCFSLHIINPEEEVEAHEDSWPTERGERQNMSLLLHNGGFCSYLYSDQESVQKAAEAEIKRAVHFTPCELSQDKNMCYIPGFLADLVSSKLSVWIKNAFLAKTMSQDHEYVIELHGVVPVDYSCTGTVENFTKWTDGLQQFVEMKHGSKMSDMTAITNYMSCVGLLQKYGNQIYGISGTLGQQAEIETLQKLYKGIKTCRIPTFKRRKLFEIEGVMADDEVEWRDKICSAITTQINETLFRSKRAVLVICETINRAKMLYNALGNSVEGKKLYINNNMDNTAIFKKKVMPGEVIIATNLAGRGTDLKVSSAVNDAGGLFVLQTFLPKNARVEAQAFGRTARQGSPGSAQLIICTTHLLTPIQLKVSIQKLVSMFEKLINVELLFRSMLLTHLRLYRGLIDQNIMPLTLTHILKKKTNLAVNIAKNARDVIVAKHLASYLEHDIPKVKKKEELFSQYLKILDDVYESSCNKPADVDVSTLNETWAMWLLMSFNEEDSIENLKTRLASDLHQARQKLTKRESPFENPHHYVAFGNKLRQSGQIAKSIEMYTKAIEKDSCWAAIAYYNRAFALLTQPYRQNVQNCLSQALEDLQNAVKSVDFYCDQIEVMTTHFKQIVSPLGDSITRFEKHMKVKLHLQGALKININEAINKVKMARTLGRDVKVNEEFVYLLVPNDLFISLVFISHESLTVIPSRNLLKVYQLLSNPSLDIVLELECLKSLGLSHIYTLDTLFSLNGLISKLFPGLFPGL